MPELPRGVKVDVSGNPGLTICTEDSDSQYNMASTEDDFRSTTWVATVSFVVGFIISFYWAGIRKYCY
jgi:hypothetical protein